jgi:hypothetical protein
MPENNTIPEDKLNALVDDEICRMIKEDPVKMFQYFVVNAGRQVVASNAGNIKISIDADIEGSRYKITTVTTVKKIKSLTHA